MCFQEIVNSYNYFNYVSENESSKNICCYDADLVSEDVTILEDTHAPSTRPLLHQILIIGERRKCIWSQGQRNKFTIIVCTIVWG